MVLLGQELHGVVDAFELAAGDRQVARMLRAAAQQDRVLFLLERLHIHIHANVRIANEGHAFVAHLLDAAVDDVFFELEVGNAVAEQAADAVVLLVDRDGVSGAAQLLRGGQAGRPAAHDGDALSGVLLGRLGADPALVPGAVDDGALNQLDRNGRSVDAEHARGLAGSGADAAGELGEVVGGVQTLAGALPAALVNEVDPVGDEVVNGAAGVAEGDAAIHAASALLALL